MNEKRIRFSVVFYLDHFSLLRVAKNTIKLHNFA